MMKADPKSEKSELLLLDPGVKIMFVPLLLECYDLLFKKLIKK